MRCRETLFRQSLPLLLSCSYGSSDKVKSLCFDTTAVNSDLRNGASVILERKMEKDMFWLACRHDIMEIILSAVVNQSLGLSSDPDIQLFKRFKNNWDKIDPSDYKTITNENISNIVENVAADRIYFAQKQLQVYLPQDHYKELLHLTIIYLGGVPEKDISFRRPAGLHCARWMAKAMYCL